MNKKLAEMKAKRLMEIAKRKGERELKNFKLKPDEQGLIELMQGAEQSKKPHQDKIDEIQKEIDGIEKLKQKWNAELKERMGEKRYGIYLRWNFQQGMKEIQELVPVMFLLAITAGIMDLILPKEKKETKSQ